MLTNQEYVRQSLELNLFFMRIMKEHSFFMEAAFPPINQSLAQQADCFKEEFSGLLAETIMLANGIISQEVLNSGELITKFTIDSERASEYYSGVKIDTEITRMEFSLGSNYNPPVNVMLVEQVSALNQRAIIAATALAEYKSGLLQDILSCKIYTFNYPLLIDHILREARFYLKMLNSLQMRQKANIIRDIIDQQVFWDQIMAEHSKFIRGLLDPTEAALFDTANRYGKEFDELMQKAITMTEQTTILPRLSAETFKATLGLRDFKAAGTEGILQCKIRSVILPLLGDHVIREANHYLRLLSTFLGQLR
ncbi:MAG: DUF2935 domain-containing protein [Desulfitobacterium hafniense]|nr:DUF2935 domain-containing protein [Desulfitobacterium hafniense]